MQTVLTSDGSALKQGDVGSVQIVVQSAELAGSDVSAQARHSSSLASELSEHEICGWPWRSTGKDDSDSKYGQVPQTLNQSAYSFHLDLPFIACLPIKTNVACDYSKQEIENLYLSGYLQEHRLNVRQSKLIKWQTMADG